MRFFEHQAQARRASRRLLWLFALAVALIVVAVNVACALALALIDPWMWRASGSVAGFVAALPRYFFETNTAVVLLFIVGGALIEGVRLRDGGAAVADMLGARAVPADPGDAAQRRLRNVAQEMAIAAGAPIPALYVLDDESAINACAAGHDGRDAAVIVTRGALDKLTRDELQGVFAHEMAHVLHGDLRLNLRLSAYVYGVLIVFQFGRAMIGYSRAPAGAPRVEGRGGLLAPAAFVFGLAIMAIGAIGWVAARLLQAAVGRQREFMADATAVGFTRLADGLGNALRKALTLAGEGAAGLANPAVATTAHAWMVAPDRFAGLFATHPPLAERIRRIFGRSMRALPVVVLAEQAEPGPAEAMRAASDAPIRFTSEADLRAVSAVQAFPNAAQGVPQAAQGVPQPAAAAPAPSGWPAQWHLAAAAIRRPVAARRVVLALLEPGRTGLLHLPAWRANIPLEPATLDPAARQALLEIAAGTLRQDPAPARAQLLRQARRLIESDNRVTLLEFAYYLTLADRLGLRDRPARPRPGGGRTAAGAALALLVRAALQWPGSSLPASTEELAHALARAERSWDRPLPAPGAARSTGALMHAIDAIDVLGPLDQALAIKALAAALGDEPAPRPAAGRVNDSALRSAAGWVNDPAPRSAAGWGNGPATTSANGRGFDEAIGRGHPEVAAPPVDPGQGALLRALCFVWGVPLPPRLDPTPPALRTGELPAMEMAASAG